MFFLFSLFVLDILFVFIFFGTRLEV
jgi:hypothetical protein